MKPKLAIQFGIAALIGAMLPAGPSAAAVVPLEPAKDTTIFSESVLESNGAGGALYVGRTGTLPGGGVRRALLAFDVGASVLPGSVVTNVSLTLHLGNVPSQSVASPTVSLHRVLKNWGEAGSVSQGGKGGAAQPGDATWGSAFFTTDQWSVPGGDFVASASASHLMADGATIQVWTSTPKLVEDVQSWVDGASDYGWILISDEQTNFSVRQFSSGDSAADVLRPVLTIEYTQAVPEPATVAMLLAGLALLLGLNRKRFV